MSGPDPKRDPKLKTESEPNIKNISYRTVPNPQHYSVIFSIRTAGSVRSMDPDLSSDPNPDPQKMKTDLYVTLVLLPIHLHYRYYYYYFFMFSFIHPLPPAKIVTSWSRLKFEPHSLLFALTFKFTYCQSLLTSFFLQSHFLFFFFLV